MKSVFAVPMVKAMEEDSPVADFETWMAGEQRRVYLLCLRLLRNSAEADSAAQDVFVKAFQALRRSGGRSIREPAKWLTRVAINTCIDRLNSNRWMFWRRHVSGDGGQALLGLIPAAGLSQEEALIEGEKLRRLNRSLRRLSERQRMVFVLRHSEGLSLKEIAQALGLEEGSVKAHMARAVRKLRDELRDVYVR